MGLWGGVLGSLCCLWGVKDAGGAAGLCHPCRYRLRKQSHDYKQGESLRGEDMTLRKVGAGWGHAGGGLAPGSPPKRGLHPSRSTSFG